MGFQDNPEKKAQTTRPPHEPARVVPLGDEISGLQQRLDGLRRKTGQLNPDSVPDQDKPAENGSQS
jgi:hypothetical protein